MDTKQLKKSIKAGTSISRSTWLELLDHAIAVEDQRDKQIAALLFAKSALDARLPNCSALPDVNAALTAAGAL